MKNTTHRFLSNETRLRVWCRDNWHCQYCGRPVFFGPSLKLLEKINPGHIYHHAHGKTGLMLSLFQWGLASVDHMMPASKGGGNDLGNLVAACWQCNNKKREKMTAEKLKLVKKESKWDGFSGLYPSLLKMAGKKDDAWSRLIQITKR